MSLCQKNIVTTNNNVDNELTKCSHTNQTTEMSDDRGNWESNKGKFQKTKRCTNVLAGVDKWNLYYREDYRDNCGLLVDQLTVNSSVMRIRFKCYQCDYSSHQVWLLLLAMMICCQDHYHPVQKVKTKSKLRQPNQKRPLHQPQVTFICCH